jgi:hypothetical protein
MSIKETKDGTIITIIVKPNAPKFNVELEGYEIVVHSTEEPVKSKVNKEILKEFSKLFHAKVELKSGATSRQKQLLIQGLTKSQIEQILHCRCVEQDILRESKHPF